MFPASPLDSAVASSRAGRRISVHLSRRLFLSAATIALATVLVAGGPWVHLQSISSEGFPAAAASPRGMSDMSIIFQLTAAALIGLLVTAVQRELQRDRPMNRSMEQAQTLLCVSGALMMIIIGNSLARAFGIAGAAAIIRFRTPVDDPRDATILFLLLALGMSAGIGALPVAGLGTLALCVLLPALDWFSGATQRTASVECTAAGPEFPVSEVRAVFERLHIPADTREFITGDAARMKYVVSLTPSHRLEDLTDALVKGAGLTAVAWDIRKKA
jgi:uncharacterized membrane protein YhiD involved in acid resistance